MVEVKATKLTVYAVQQASESGEHNQGNDVADTRRKGRGEIVGIQP